MKCGEYIGEILRARDIVHIEHLQSRDMAGHVVLNELYDDLLDHADSIAEMRLARGKVPISIKSIPEEVNIVKYLESEFLPMTDDAKKMADSKGMNDISAEIDMIKTTIMKKLYKLKNLVGKENLGQIKETEESDMMEGGILYKKKKCKGGKLKCGGGKLIR